MHILFLSKLCDVLKKSTLSDDLLSSVIVRSYKSERFREVEFVPPVTIAFTRPLYFYSFMPDAPLAGKIELYFLRSRTLIREILSPQRAYAILHNGVTAISPRNIDKLSARSYVSVQRYEKQTCVILLYSPRAVNNAICYNCELIKQ